MRKINMRINSRLLLTEILVCDILSFAEFNTKNFCGESNDTETRATTQTTGKNTKRDCIYAVYARRKVFARRGLPVVGVTETIFAMVGRIHRRRNSEDDRIVQEIKNGRQQRSWKTTVDALNPCHGVAKSASIVPLPYGSVKRIYPPYPLR